MCIRDSVVWGPVEEVGIKMLESIQKKFLKFLYYKDFTYYDTSLTYRKLVIGYEMNELRLRRDLTILKQLYNVVNGECDTPYLLSKINIYVPPRLNRAKRTLFLPSKARTNILSKAPLERMMTLYNTLLKEDCEIDIFFNTKKEFERRVMQALVHSYT